MSAKARCDARQPRSFNRCRLRAGHGGYHHSWGMANGGGDDHDEQWPTLDYEPGAAPEPCVHHVMDAYCGQLGCRGFGRSLFEQGWHFVNGAWQAKSSSGAPPAAPADQDKIDAAFRAATEAVTKVQALGGHWEPDQLAYAAVKAALPFLGVGAPAAPAPRDDTNLLWEIGMIAQGVNARNKTPVERLALIEKLIEKAWEPVGAAPGRAPAPEAPADFRVQMYEEPNGGVRCVVTGMRTGVQAEGTGGRWLFAFARAVIAGETALAEMAAYPSSPAPDFLDRLADNLDLTAAQRTELRVNHAKWSAELAPFAAELERSMDPGDISIRVSGGAPPAARPAEPPPADPVRMFFSDADVGAGPWRTTPRESKRRLWVTLDDCYGPLSASLRVDEGAGFSTGLPDLMGEECRWLAETFASAAAYIAGLRAAPPHHLNPKET